jgi:hypothetical protein
MAIILKPSEEVTPIQIEGNLGDDSVAMLFLDPETKQYRHKSEEDFKKVYFLEMDENVVKSIEFFL